MVAAVGTLTNIMKQLMHTVGQSNANPVNPTASKALKLAIREEVNEMEEREKRKSSIVVQCLLVETLWRFLRMLGSML